MKINIVGAKFHPPAQGVVESLPRGFPLVLISDRLNQYDDKAIRVLVDMRRFVAEGGDMDGLTERVQGYGWQADELCSYADPCWIGFLARTGAKTCGNGPGNGEVWEAFGEALDRGVHSVLTFDGNGWPQAELTGGAHSFSDAVVDPEWIATRPFNE